MNCVKGILRDTMKDLGEKDIKDMKHRLRDDGKIKWNKLEKADGNDIVDFIVEGYTEEKSVETVIKMLKKMDLNQKVEDLLKCLADNKAENPASKSDDSTAEKGFQVGDRVRVKASVVEPKHKWASVTHSSVGVVKAFNPGGLMLVDFPGRPGWRAEPSEMELQGFVVGDRVRVKATVKEPKHKWGIVTHSSVGVVKAFTPNGRMLVDFPGHSAWSADPSEMEYHGFMIGDRVRVKASVKEPTSGEKWGEVTHSSVGVVKAYTQTGLMLVDFPGETGWKANPADMELVGFKVGDRVRVKASVVEPKHKWGSVTHSSVGVVKEFTQNSLMLVDFPGESNWKADPVDMECIGFMVGDRVRVKASVQSPKQGWGRVTHSSVGVVKAFTPDGRMLVDFPGQPEWRADPNEMELRGFVVGDRVLVKASIKEPKYKWGEVTHRSVGVVKGFQGDGTMVVKFPGIPEWKADPNEMDLQDSDDEEDDDTSEEDEQDDDEGEDGSKGFSVGDRVRVKASVKKPKFEWGGVTHRSVGVVRGFRVNGIMLVDFPGSPKWRADPNELELQGFVVGDRVLVKASVKEPKHKWNEVTHSSVGVVKGFQDDGTMLVDFPGIQGWKADPNDMEIQGFSVGDKVRVKASVKKPSCEWGHITHRSVGVVKGFQNDGIMLVDFPKSRGWRADPNEMELQDSDDVDDDDPREEDEQDDDDDEDGEGEDGSKGFSVGDKVRVKASVKKPKYNWGNITHRSVGVVKAFIGKRIMVVKFREDSDWYADPADMELAL